MNYPEIWEKYKPHSHYVSALMEEYKNKFNWRADGKDSLMDIGCAGGGITIECILPIMPPNFDRIIGVDISKDMIGYAQKTHTQPKIEFKTFDIVTGDTDELPQVDHIVSIYAFHLLKNHEKALSNIYNLLKPGSDCFIMFIPHFPYYSAYEQIATHPKWSKYIKNVNDVIVPCYYSKNPESDFEQLLKECHFSSVKIITKEKTFEIGDINILKNFIKTLHQFYQGIPVAEYDAFTSDIAQLALNVFNSAANNKHSTESQVYLPVRNLIAYARKM